MRFATISFQAKSLVEAEARNGPWADLYNHRNAKLLIKVEALANACFRCGNAEGIQPSSVTLTKSTALEKPSAPSLPFDWMIDPIAG